MKINYGLVSRSLLALLFVVAGFQKLINFGNTVSFLEKINIPLPVVATIIVVIIEVPVAIMFAYGYKIKQMGNILIGFTILVTLIIHRDYFGQDAVMVLKNLSIVGGLMSAIACTCNTCGVHKKHAEQ